MIELYWLAGLLEGEGSFLAGPPSRPNCPRIQLAMTDEDVVERVARLFGRRVWRSDRGAERGYKPVFQTVIKGAGAVHLMEALRPVMGERRRSQIDRALARPHVRRLRWHIRPMGCNTPRCERPAHTKGLCKTHYRSWWKSNTRGHRSEYVPVDLAPPAGIQGLDALAEPKPGQPQAFAWLAGLLEGEGTFEASKHRGHRYPRISLEMCDEDVIRRVANLLEGAAVWRAEPRHPGWNPTFGSALVGGRAATKMSELLPHMGRRRSGVIRNALDAYQPIRLTQAPAHCVVNGCSGEHRSRGLCHKHYMSWTRDVKRGRIPRITPLR